MSRYIDADALSRALAEMWYDSPISVTGVSVSELINKQPSIEIVRCKECKHNPWDFNRTDYTCIWDDDFADRPQTPNDFCSYGEREGE